MPKITFDTYGNPKPYEIVLLSLDEIEAIFVRDFPLSTTRAKNFNNYKLYTKALYEFQVEPFYQWLAGSFTTKKQNPNDIDLVNFIDYTKFDKDLKLFDMQKSNGFPKQIYNIDGYNVLVFPESHPYYVKMVQQREYWQRQFGSDRQERPKALIEVHNR